MKKKTIREKQQTYFNPKNRSERIYDASKGRRQETCVPAGGLKQMYDRTFTQRALAR